MKSFFQIDGPVMRAMSDVMILVLLNVLTLLFCIPVITAGAALASMHYILMQMPEQQEGHILKTFLAQFRSNLKNATLPWLILLAAGALLFFYYRLFGGKTGRGPMQVLIFLGALILMMLYVWLFPLLARFNYPLRGGIQNSFLLAAAYLPRTLAMAAISAVIPLVLILSLRLLPLAFLAGLTLPGYFCMLIYRGVIEGLVEKALGKQETGAESGGTETADTEKEKQQDNKGGEHAI